MHKNTPFYTPVEELDDEWVRRNIEQHEENRRKRKLDFDELERLAELYYEKNKRSFVSLPHDTVTIYDILSQYRDKGGVK